MTPSPPGEELFDLVDHDDRVIGQATRKEVHGNPALMHRVVHVLVFNSQGNIFLQKRAADKDVQPGKWDTSVGGHVDAGEERFSAALRELSEELDIPGRGIPGRSIPGSGGVPHLEYLHTYSHSNEFESELVSTWMTCWDGPIEIQQSEISEGRFWELEAIDLLTGQIHETSPFTPNFLDELKRWRTAGSPRP